MEKFNIELHKKKNNKTKKRYDNSQEEFKF